MPLPADGRGQVALGGRGEVVRRHPQLVGRPRRRRRRPGSRGPVVREQLGVGSGRRQGRREVVVERPRALLHQPQPAEEGGGQPGPRAQAVAERLLQGHLAQAVRGGGEELADAADAHEGGAVRVSRPPWKAPARRAITSSSLL